MAVRASAWILPLLVHLSTGMQANIGPRVGSVSRLHRHTKAGILVSRRRHDELKQILPPDWFMEEADSLRTDSMSAAPVPHSPQPIVEQQLFRHRFLVSSDMCIRLPNEATTLLRAFVVHPQLSGVINLQLEAFRPLSKVKWSPDASRMLALPNAGGSSLLSEALALELLARAFGASLERTELELLYERGSKMTDFAVTLFGGYALGVSVTRAYKWRSDGTDRPYGLEMTEARRLLKKKLHGINTSTRNVCNFRWDKQILCVWAFSSRDAALLEQVYQELPAGLRSNTVLVITRCDGAAWINDKTPAGVSKAAYRSGVKAAYRSAADRAPTKGQDPGMAEGFGI